MNPVANASPKQLRVERVFRPSRLAPGLLATAYEILLPIAPRPLKPLSPRQPSTRIPPSGSARNQARAAASV